MSKTKITCGTDIIEINRIKQNIEDGQIGEKFIEKVYTPLEIKYCESKKIQKYQHYAARFAAKEACLKAISGMLPSKFDISWKDIEVINDEQGKPSLKIYGVDTQKIESMDISLSHCKEYAVAMVTILWRNYEIF